MPPRSRGARSAASSSSRASQRGRGSRARAAVSNDVPIEYQELLHEALQAAPDATDSPRKRRRVGHREPVSTEPRPYEDVVESDTPASKEQIVYLSEDSDVDFEDVALGEEVEEEADLDLTLKKPVEKAVQRRKATTNADRNMKLEMHKMHVLCLLSSVNRRNHWCNSDDVHKKLRPLLTEKMRSLLKPRASLSQFDRTESLKKGLNQINATWKLKYRITSKGMSKAQWMDERGVTELEAPLDKEDFVEAARKLEGSRDTGAQLYCALLRSIGVECRLVCSLQVLSFTGKDAQTRSYTPAPSLPASDRSTPETPDMEPVDIYSHEAGFGEDSTSPVAPRRRLGHPAAASYNLPSIPRPVPPPKKKRGFRESAFPVFWVEVLDVAHQKWMPVDVLVTDTVGKPRALEPPASDAENAMTYVMAFEAEGTARDVTRRYTKAYNAKTRKLRVECTAGGDRWWKRTLRAYDRGWNTDLDQIEDNELAAMEAREPMPKNVVDFKDHPLYALERHLKKNEVLVNRHQVGRLAVGQQAEPVFRRSDVKTARSADRWYRMGREVREGEQPVKANPAKGDEEVGVGLYTEDQTTLYHCPPVVNGRVPKNTYGNLDVYVPTMVPTGGIHLPLPEASRASRLLGIDYADAVTGFEFRGRRGTAVVRGIVCATEYQEAVEAVVRGFHDAAAMEEEERRSVLALAMWKRFLVAVRIKQRIDGYEIEGEAAPEPESDHGYRDAVAQARHDDYADEGGGFFAE